MRALLGGFSGLLAMCLLIPSGIGAAITETKLTASDATADKFFGWSVAISGDIVVVGSPGKVRGPVGSAYVFQRRGGVWSQQAKLTASGGSEDAAFGWSVAINGDTVVVGAPFDGDLVGSAFVFVRSGTTWSQQAKLTASDASDFDTFGYSLTMSSETLVVGAARTSEAGDFSGSAYVFVRNGASWSQQAKLIPSDGVGSGFFGESVSISGDRVVVGAKRNNGGAGRSGSAYVFRRSGTVWSQEAKLTASDAATGDFFGFSVAISGDMVVVGATGDDDAGDRSGSVYVFQRSGTTWSQVTKLAANDAAALDFFGSEVAVQKATLVITGSGAAYLFRRRGGIWSQQERFTPSDTASGFAGEAAMSEGTIIVGAFLDDNAGTNAGSAYVYELSKSVKAMPWLQLLLD